MRPTPHGEEGEDDVMFYAVVWIAVGAGAAIVANVKGRSPARWLVLGAFFGPLATGAVCFMPAIPEKDAVPPIPVRRLCPYCSNEIAPSARMCKWCKSIV
jgi:hypothetical protein